MNVLVTDQGFAAVPATAFVPLADLAAHQGAVDLAHTDDPTALAGHLPELTVIRIAFPAFSDGRAFTIARRLRMLGFRGTLRANGPVIADQYAMLRRVGFDDVEIPDAVAARQPQEDWKFRGDWRAHDYQSRLKA